MKKKIFCLAFIVLLFSGFALIAEDNSLWGLFNGAIHSQVKTKNQTSEEWHYYISSKPLTAQELLKTARKEWSVETMHWLLDVHFYEDMCRVHDATIQQVCNMGRKIALNLIKTYKQKTNSKSSLKSIMLKALINPSFILKILQT